MHYQHTSMLNLDVKAVIHVCMHMIHPTYGQPHIRRWGAPCSS
jgi:hypothetical protein